MFGNLKKKKGIFLLLTTITISVLLYFAFSLNKSNLSNKLISLQQNEKFSIKDIAYENMSGLFKDSEVVEFTNDKVFLPKILNTNNLLFGSLRDTELTDKNISYLDLNTGDYTTINDVNLSEGYLTVLYIAANEKYFLYSYLDGNNEVYLYNLITKENNKLESLNSYTFSNQSQCILYNDSIIFNVFNKKAETYATFCYSIENDAIEIIENENSGYPVIIDQKLYYLKIDKTALKTKLIEYDITKKEKTILLEQSGNEQYISSVFGNGNDLIITISINNNTQLTSSNYTLFYQLDLENNVADLLFKLSQGEILSFENNYLYFTGRLNGAGDSPRENYIYDYKNNLFYKPLGQCIFSNKSIVYIEPKNTNVDIPKGADYTNEYSQIRYSNFEN